MSKGEVLRDVYPEELEMVLQKINEKQRTEEVRRLDGYINQFYAGGAFKSESVERYWQELIERYDRVTSTEEESAVPDPEEGIEKLKKFQGMIIQTQQQKKRGGGRN